MILLGIDIGGSAIKGAPVDIQTGELAGERYRLVTPAPSTPESGVETVAHIVRHFDWHGPVGVTFPGVVKNGVTLSAANVDKGWIGYPAQKAVAEATGCPVALLNDADAAGIAEMQLGAGRGERGPVLMFTFGTGIGSAFFMNGLLFPNTELGHVQLRGKDAEHRAAARVRSEKDLSWKQWANRVNEFLAEMDKLFSPDLVIIGGGISKDHAKYFKFLKSQARLAPAQFFNNAGIIGAAQAAVSLVNEQVNE